MKYAVTAILILGSIGIAMLVFAGSDHDRGSHSHGPIDKVQAIDRARFKVQQLVDQKKLPASWAKVTTINAVQKIFSKGPEWVVSLTNSKIEDPGKQTLYLFYTLDGRYIAANYTGN